MSNVNIPQAKPVKKAIQHKTLVKAQMEEIGFTDLESLHTEIANIVAALKALPEVLNTWQLMEAFDLIHHLDSKRFQKRNLELPWVVSALYIRQ